MTIEFILVFIAIIAAAVAYIYWQDLWWGEMNVYRPGSGGEKGRGRSKELRVFFNAALTPVLPGKNE